MGNPWKTKGKPTGQWWKIDDLMDLLLPSIGGSYWCLKRKQLQDWSTSGLLGDERQRWQYLHTLIWKFHVRDESMTVNDSERRWYKKQKNAINTNLQFILAGAKHSQCLLKACLQAGDDAVLRLGSWMRKHLRIPALICSCLCSWHHAMMSGDDTEFPEHVDHSSTAQVQYAKI